MRLLSRAELVILAAVFFDFSTAFNITPPATANVDVVNNIAANWTWFSGEPTYIMIQLFAYKEDICVFGQSNPVQARNIFSDIEEAKEIDGKKVGSMTFEADKIGQYILCGYEDISGGGKLNLLSIANSSIFEVARPAFTQTTMFISTTPITPTPLSAPSTTPEKPSLSTGTIIGATVAGTLAFSLLVAGVVMIYRRKRHTKQHLYLAAESIISPYPDTNISTTKTERKGRRRNVSAEQNQDNRRERRMPPIDTPDIRNNSSSRPQGERRVVYHDDSGWRPLARVPTHSDGGTTASVLDVPPRYDAAM